MHSVVCFQQGLPLGVPACRKALPPVHQEVSPCFLGHVSYCERLVDWPAPFFHLFIAWVVAARSLCSIALCLINNAHMSDAYSMWNVSAFTS